MNLKYKLWQAAALLIAVSAGQSALAAQTLTIKGSAEASGDVIQLADDAQLNLTADGSGITVTLPDVDVRMRCLGDPTAEGYCLLSAWDGTSVGDSDGDGVPDDSDLCFSTPAGSFVNSSGCSCDQLPSNDACNDGGGDGGGGGGGGTTPTDTDGDGVPDSSDNCVNDANANQADNDGDGIGNACDSTPDGDGGGTGGGTGTYCSNKAASNVVCTASQNLDNWWQTRGQQSFTIPRNKILSLPFTARASSTDAAMMVYSTDMSSVTGYSWSSWVSTRPAGDRVQSKCYKAGNEARGNFYMTQKPAQTAECNLGTAGGVYYLNYRVYSSTNGYYGTDYKFDIGRNAY